MARSITARVLLFLLLGAALVAATKPAADEIVKRHLAEGLNGAVLAAGQVRDIRGAAQVSTPAKAAGALTGSFRVISTAASSRMTLQFNTDLYEGETWAADGPEVEVGFAQPRTSARSALGLFLWVNKAIVGEGLLGGVLNARWPLLDVAGREAKVSYDGLKKLGGRELHRLRYRASQRQGPLQVMVFLEPETYRHIATVYTTSQAQGMGLTPETSSQQQELVYRLEEWFSDFERFGAITLPKTWTLRYERSGNTTSEWKYELRLESFEEREQKPAGRGRTASRAVPFTG
jgi:hypothetical protein